MKSKPLKKKVSVKDSTIKEAMLVSIKFLQTPKLSLIPPKKVYSALSQYENNLNFMMTSVDKYVIKHVMNYVNYYFCHQKEQLTLLIFLGAPAR